MDCSKEKAKLETGEETKNQDLLSDVARLTGLPPEWITLELKKIARERGLDSNQMNIDDLRFLALQILDRLNTEIEQDPLCVESLQALQDMHGGGDDVAH